MKRLAIIVLLSAAAVFGQSVLKVFDVPSPGMGGMNSQFDLDVMRPVDSRYSENIDITDNPGLLQPRKGYAPYDTIQRRLAYATSFYDPTFTWKMIVGGKYLDSGRVIGSSYDLASASTKSVVLRNSQKIFRLMATDTFGVTFACLPADSNANNTTYGSVRKFTDFCAYDQGMFASAYGRLPVYFSTKSRSTASGSLVDNYGPKFLEMSIIRPGQPRVQVIDKQGDSGLTGIVEYCYAYRSASSIGDTGYHSAIVEAKNQWVLVSQFVCQPRTVAGTDTICVFRRPIARSASLYPSYTTYDSSWKMVAEIILPDTGCAVIVDSGQTCPSGYGSSDIGEMAGWGIDHYAYSNTIKQPGKMVLEGYSNDSISKGFEYSESVKVCYSFFDPVTGLESSMSPGKIDRVSLPIAFKSPFTYYTKWRLPRIASGYSPTTHVRVYRSIHNDTMTFYCEYQGPISNLQPYLGGIADSVFDDQGDPWQYLSRTTSYAAFDKDGDKVIRPPLVGPNTITFSDMEYSSGRLWGIGDPLYPSRLYYSGYEDFNDWSAIYYFSMDEGQNDELVAIEGVDGAGGEVLYAFKHNSIYAASGYDPEYDLSIRRLTNQNGAIGRQTVLRVGDLIYFMNTDKVICRLSGGAIDTISKVIQDYVDTTFTTADSIRAYYLDKRVMFAHIYRNDNHWIAYNIESGTWSVEKYNYGFIPVGSFLYDTLQNHKGFDQFSTWLYEKDDSATCLYHEYSGRIDSIRRLPPTGEVLVYDTITSVVEPVFTGDGEHLWQIRDIQMTAAGDSNTYIVCELRNESGTVLETDSVRINKNVENDYTVSFAEHTAKYISIRIKGKLSVLRNCRATVRRVGRAEL